MRRKFIFSFSFVPQRQIVSGKKEEKINFYIQKTIWFKGGEFAMKFDKSILARVHTRSTFNNSKLIGGGEKIDRRIRESTRSNDKEIAIGLQRAQEMRTQ